LRKKGFEGRRLGPKQMTTDTAVRVARLVVQEKSKEMKIEIKCLLTTVQFL
jgi:ribosome biogenesis SPOUT family RNA methylase Rps3